MKLFKSNKGTILFYVILSLVIIALTFLCLLSNSSFNYYPIVITVFAFVLGAGYLLLMLRSASKKTVINDKNKNLNVVIEMGSNFLRFLLIALGIVVSFLFIRFTPHEGDIPKWVYALVLINGVPMFIDICLFYLRSKYVE